MPESAHDPSEFAGIERAMEVIAGTSGVGGRIVDHGDYDVDGVCATAITIRALRDLGADAGCSCPAAPRTATACQPARWPAASPSGARR